jgi:hypothetical protein
MPFSSAHLPASADGGEGAAAADGMMETEGFQDAMYHSAIASRLASAAHDNDTKLAGALYIICCSFV